MGKLQPIDKKTTDWVGLWWHPEYGCFTSESLSLAGLRQFKGHVRLYVRKNKFFEKGKNGRPNYHFCLKDAKTDNPREWAVFDDDEADVVYYRKEDGEYKDENGNRLYTRDEAWSIVHGVMDDVKYGIEDAGDLDPDDYI